MHQTRTGQKVFLDQSQWKKQLVDFPKVQTFIVFDDCVTFIAICLFLHLMNLEALFAYTCSIPQLKTLFYTFTPQTDNNHV